MSIAETISALNTFLRNVLGIGVLAAASAVGWVGYEHLNRGERIGEFREQLRQVTSELESQKRTSEQLQAEVDAKVRQIEKLDTALHLVKVDHRLAEIRVLRQTIDPESQRARTEIEFVEISERGDIIGSPKQFVLDGDKVYVDYWVVKFDDSYVEQAELNRATSICLFRGIHGEYQSPAEAFRLDTVGSRPAAYARGTAMSEFEQQIWTDFWDIANDPERARRNGIRAAHGEEPYTAVREGMAYRLELRASGGLSIAPIAPSSRRVAEPVIETPKPSVSKPFAPRRELG